jgi:DNA uptake protein ComE-like DNA-binding protein
MTPPVADAILDWLDPDDQPRQFGAEDETYRQYDPPYAPRNGPLASLDELLLVRGVTPELLWGVDQNRNYFVDAGETRQGALAQMDDPDGYLNRGWSAYLTLASAEAMAGGVGGRVDVNGPQLQTIYNSLKTSLDDGQAKFIILYRQYGASNTQQPSEPGRPDPGDSNANAPNANQRQDANNRGANQRSGGATVSAAGIELNFQQQPAATINSLLDLVGAQVQVPSQPRQGENQNQNQNQNGQTQTVESPWQDTAAGYRDLLRLYDAACAGQLDRVAGRVNLNAASRPVLRSIPGLAPAAVNQIVAARELEPDRVLSEQRHPIWPLLQGFVTLDEMRLLERYVTTRGDALGGQAVGFFDAGPIVARGQFVLDRSGTTPRLRLWRELTPWGPGFSPQLLGAQPEPTQLQ